MSHIVTQHVYILRAVNVLLPSMVGGFLLLVKIITTLYFLYLNQSKTLPLYTYHINCRGVVAFQFQNFKVIIKLKTGDAKNYCMGPFSNVLSCSKYKRLTCWYVKWNCFNVFVHLSNMIKLHIHARRLILFGSLYKIVIDAPSGDRTHDNSLKRRMHYHCAIGA